MSDDGSVAPGTPPSDAAPAGPEDGSPGGGLRAFWVGLRRAGLRALAVLGVLVLFLLLSAGAAGWYTSRPEFCNSCHIMEPYYKSWQKSTHKNVPCIDCHFAPGFGGKLRGKMLGLVQLAKYVTSSEGPRPAAEIPDESCLRSGCHEKRLLSGKVTFQGIPFDHEPHLKDLRREKKLRCTSCHSQIMQGTHMAVTETTCFLCHFKDEEFNAGLGTCTRCHAIPEQKFDLGGGAIFTHELALKRNVDCANCHGDVIRGKGEVPREHCAVCHNREDDLKQIDDHEFMHKKHVSEHKVDCLACHLQIQHSKDRQKIEHAASDCQSCHPDHHREQVDMLRGRGAETIPAQANGMLSVRLECRTCHQKREVSSTGTVLWKASGEVCAMCHDRSTAERLELYRPETKKALDDIDSAVGRAREALNSAQVAPDRKTAIAAQLDAFQHDLGFLRAANPVHNIHYATTLTNTVLDRLSAVCRELKIAAPEVKLPAPVEGRKAQPVAPPGKK